MTAPKRQKKVSFADDDHLGGAAEAAAGEDWGSAEDEESSASEERRPAAPRKSAQLRATAFKRRPHRRGGTGIDPDVQTMLEQNAVGPTSQRLYRVPVERLLDFAKRNNIDLSSQEGVDACLVRVLNEDFFKGYEISRGNHLMAGWLHHFPE